MNTTGTGPESFARCTCSSAVVAIWLEVPDCSLMAYRLPACARNQAPVRQASRMQIDAAAPVTARPMEIETAAAAAETDGYDGFGVPETRHDEFESLALSAQRTSTIHLNSSIHIAFTSHPLTHPAPAISIHLL